MSNFFLNVSGIAFLIFCAVGFYSLFPLSALAEYPHMLEEFIFMATASASSLVISIIAFILAEKIPVKRENYSYYTR